MISTRPVAAVETLEDPIDAGKSALKKTGAPWYDVETDEVRIVAEQKSTEAGERQDWRQEKKRPDWEIDWDWPWNRNSAGGGVGGGWSLFSLTIGQLIQVFMWLIILAIIGWLLYLFIKSLPEPDESHASLSRAEEDNRTDEERIENLPIQPTVRKGDFLSMARSSYDAGNYADAIVYLFSHRLLQLDRAGFIRLTRGKTNRQYLYEITESGQLYSILGQTIVCFEDVFFGKHKLSKDRFEKSWNSNDEFDSIIKQAMS